MVDVEAWADAWTGLAAVVEAGATLITALVAVVAVFYASAQVRQARQLRQEQTRPFVTVAFRQSHSIVCNIVIRNEGLTVARDVMFRFTPEFESSNASRNQIRESKLWREGVPTLVPGQEISIFADKFPDRYKREDLPRVYEVQVTYRGAEPRTPSRVRAGRSHPPGELFELRYMLDFDIFYGYSTAATYTIHEVAEALRRMDSRLAGWTEHASGPLSVVTRDGDAMDRAEREEVEAAVLAAREESEGLAAARRATRRASGRLPSAELATDADADSSGPGPA